MPNLKMWTKRPLRRLLCHTREDFSTHMAKNKTVRQNARLDGPKEQMCTLIIGLMSELGRSARDPRPGPSGGAVEGRPLAAPPPLAGPAELCAQLGAKRALRVGSFPSATPNPQQKWPNKKTPSFSVLAGH